MSLAEELHRIDFERARANPAAVFSSPKAVLRDQRFPGFEKLEILRQWAHDADLLAIAESEGMAGGESAMLGRVLAALHEVQASMQRAGTEASDSDRSRD